MAHTRFAYTNLLEAASVVLLNGPAVVTGAINQWTAASATVTRAAGSYVTDGVKPWSLVSGNLAAKFPAGTRVQSVTALTLILTSIAIAGPNGTDSATFTPTQPSNQLAAYPMTNALNGERYIPWFSAQPPAASPVIVEFDLGSSQGVNVAAALNHPALSGTYISSIVLEYAITYGTWVSIAPGGLWGMDWGNNWGGGVADWAPGILGVDSGIAFPLQGARFWRFKITNTGAFSVGRLWLGVIQSDMGGRYSPGTVKRTVKNRVRELSPSGVQQSFYNGRALHEWRYRFNGSTNTMLAALDNVVQQAKTVVLFDDNNAVYEVEAAEDALDWTMVFTDLQDFPSVAFRELY